MRGLKPRSVRVRLTLWHIGFMLLVLGVYASAVYTIVRDNSSRLMDERLHDDFDWASDMLAQRPDGSIAPYDETGEGDSPWLQVWSLDGQLLYDTPEARRNPVPESHKLADGNSGSQFFDCFYAPLRRRDSGLWRYCRSYLGISS